MKIFLTLLTAGLVGNLILVAPLPAADYDSEQTSAVQEHGRIDTVDLKERYVIIDDSRYALAPNVRIHSASGSSSSLSSLRRGMRVAFTVESRSGAGARTITELVIRSDR